MGQPAAKQGELLPPSTCTRHGAINKKAPVPTPSLPHPFAGMIDGNLSPTVKIRGMLAATVGSTATNMLPATWPTPPGTMFQIPPTNRATIMVEVPQCSSGGNPPRGRATWPRPVPIPFRTPQHRSSPLERC